MVTKKNLTKKQWEDVSFLILSDGGIEPARESSLNDTGNREQAKSVEQTDVLSENQQLSIRKRGICSSTWASYKRRYKECQSILVRHHNTDNSYCHLVYNRIGYDGKVIPSQSDYKHNEIATKLLKDKYGLSLFSLTNGTDPEQLVELENLFEPNRDDRKIRQIREDVETYEEEVQKQASLTEQARLKEQAARELDSQAKSIKDKSIKDKHKKQQMI